MRIRVLGGGWYGCHLTHALKQAGHQVELHEIAKMLFSGASGSNPARLHFGFHYPRSKLTRAACQEHHLQFMERYGHITRFVPVNIYAVAAHDSMVDFGNYAQTLFGEVEFITIFDPSEYGLENVEGALLTGERHILIDDARSMFKIMLGESIRFDKAPNEVDSKEWDWTIDCTFCAMDSENIERYEPCVTGLLKGPVNRAVTIMDGPFPSIYPWDEQRRLCSITSAKFTPFDKCATHAEAKKVLEQVGVKEAKARIEQMIEQMEVYWPSVREMFELNGYQLAIRAMPRSGAAARLVDVIRVGERALRVRAGKIDAIVHAEQIVKDMIS